MEPYRRKVRYWDVDANAHVFNARYFIYFDDALTDFFEESGVDFGTHGEGPLWVVAHASCDFRGEATLGDLLATSVSVERIGNTSITFAFKTIEERSGRTVATGKEIYVAVDQVTRTPTPVPDDVRDKLAPYAVTFEE